MKVVLIFDNLIMRNILEKVFLKKSKLFIHLFKLLNKNYWYLYLRRCIYNVRMSIKLLLHLWVQLQSLLYFYWLIFPTRRTSYHYLKWQQIYVKWPLPKRNSPVDKYFWSLDLPSYGLGSTQNQKPYLNLVILSLSWWIPTKPILIEMCFVAAKMKVSFETAMMVLSS